MEQKNTKAASLLQKKKKVDKWLALLRPLTYLGFMLAGFFFAACERNPVYSKLVNVFPAISNKVILDWNANAIEEGRIITRFC